MSDNTDALGHSTADLLPSEKIAIMEIQTLMLRKWNDLVLKGKFTEKNLGWWAEETQNRFKEIGLVAFVDPLDVELDENGNDYFFPVVTITGRLEDSEFDFEQAKHETQHGLADGIEGRITEKGVWLPPKTTL